jgi:hypothetical protein
MDMGDFLLVAGYNCTIPDNTGIPCGGFQVIKQMASELHIYSGYGVALLPPQEKKIFRALQIISRTQLS